VTKLRPRALSHRGVIRAAGFHIDAALLGGHEARRRILALWTPGSSVYRIGNGLVIRLALPVVVECDHSPGVPLIHLQGSLYGAPFARDELEMVSAPVNSVVLVRAGEAVIEPLSDRQLESVETWIEVGSFVSIQVRSLGEEMAPPRSLAERVEFDPRKQLEGVPPGSPELNEVISALRSKVGLGKKEARFAPVESSFLIRFRSSLVRAASGIRSLIMGLGSPRGLKRASHRIGSTRTTNEGAAQAKKPLFQRLSVRLHTLRWRVLLTTRLARLIGSVQARYFAKVMELFERGDLNEALRHAIPLGGEFESQVLRPALWKPIPRSNLSFSPHFTRARSVIALGDSLLSRLRNLYRESFERLEAQGRIEEAAFVLAELLHANEEAVVFLERHGRLRLAAEMAEARELSPGLVVRQWFVAGDVQRAILIARRTGAFSDAVVRLERRERQLAEKLRLLWATALADAGDYSAAVDAIWPVNEGRRLALGWLDNVIQLGGPAGARALARKLEVAPEDFETLRDRAADLLEDESVEGASTRVAFAEAIRHGTRTSQSKAVARMAVRAIIRDSGTQRDAMNNIQFRHLIDFSGDGALRADAPALDVAVNTPLNETDPALQFQFEESDSGSVAIRDLVFLPNGRTLVALGEAGALLLNHEGRTIDHFDQPADRLVISDHLDCAIAMARRGEVWRLARLDLLSRHAEEWCEARVDAFASNYDGSMWFIGARENFYAIDVNSKRFDALWRVPDVGGAVVLVARSKTSCRFVTAEWGPTEEWIYDLPLLRLRGRSQFRLGGAGQICLKSCLALAADGALVNQSSYADIVSSESQHRGPQQLKEAELATQVIPSDLILRLFLAGALQREMRIGEQGCVPGEPAISDFWVASPVVENGRCRIRLIDREKFNTRLDVFLGHAEVVLRLTDEWVTIADGGGRLLVLELRSGRLIRNLRV
jgi:MoxR-vWA-beta-propeller ternary system domain bpX6